MAWYNFPFSKPNKPVRPPVTPPTVTPRGRGVIRTATGGVPTIGPPPRNRPPFPEWGQATIGPAPINRPPQTPQEAQGGGGYAGYNKIWDFLKSLYNPTEEDVIEEVSNEPAINPKTGRGNTPRENARFAPRQGRTLPRRNPNTKGLELPPIPKLPVTSTIDLEGGNNFGMGYPEVVEEQEQNPFDIPERTNPFIEEYRTHLGRMPNRADYKPSTWEKIAATLTAVGGGDAQGQLNRRYNEAVMDWLAKEEPMRNLVEQDYKYNNPVNDIKIQKMLFDMQDRRTRTDLYGDKTRADINFREKQAEALEYAGFKKVIGEDGMVYMVRGNEVYETGLSSLEYARFKETQSSNAVRARQGWARVGQGAERVKQGQTRIEDARKRFDVMYGTPEKK